MYMSIADRVRPFSVYLESGKNIGSNLREFSPWNASPAFLQELHNCTVLVAEGAAGSEFSPQFAPQTWRVIPGTVFLELLAEETKSLGFPPNEYLQFFYAKPSQEYVLDGTVERNGETKRRMDVVIKGIQLVLSWDTNYSEFVLYLPQARMRSWEEMDADQFPPDTVDDTIIRLTADETRAVQIFDEVREYVGANPQVCLRDLSFETEGVRNRSLQR